MVRVNYDKETGKVLGFDKDTIPFIELTEEQIKIPLPDKYSYYAVVDGVFTIATKIPTEQEKAADALAAKNKRLTEIQKWFNNNDWLINKVYLGEWDESDPRFVEYLEKRAQLRKEHEELTKGGN